jgi:hypothetical protein
VKKLKQIVNIKITSRRERMTYWLIFLGFVMFTVSIASKASLLDTAVLFTAISAVGAWYIKQETDKSSENKM